MKIVVRASGFYSLTLSSEHSLSKTMMVQSCPYYLTWYRLKVICKFIGIRVDQVNLAQMNPLMIEQDKAAKKNAPCFGR